MKSSILQKNDPKNLKDFCPGSLYSTKGRNPSNFCVIFRKIDDFINPFWLNLTFRRNACQKTSYSFELAQVIYYVKMGGNDDKLLIKKRDPLKRWYFFLEEGKPTLIFVMGDAYHTNTKMQENLLEFFFPIIYWAKYITQPDWTIFCPNRGPLGRINKYEKWITQAVSAK